MTSLILRKAINSLDLLSQHFISSVMVYKHSEQAIFYEKIYGLFVMFRVCLSFDKASSRQIS